MNQNERQMSQNGKSHIRAKVTKWQLSQKGKSLKTAIVTKRQLSHNGKSLKTAIVLRRQMSYTAFVTDGIRNFLKSKKGKRPKAAFVSEGKWP